MGFPGRCVQQSMTANAVQCIEMCVPRSSEQSTKTTRKQSVLLNTRRTVNTIGRVKGKPRCGFLFLEPVSPTPTTPVDVKKQRERQVPYPDCRKIPEEKCVDVPKKECTTVQEEKCRSEPYQKCDQIPKKECNNVHKKIPNRISK